MVKKEIFLDNLPRWKTGSYKGKINWNESIGYKVHFIYDDIEGDLEIIDYIKGRNQKVKIKYNNNLYDVSCCRMRTCQIGNQLLNKRTSNFRYEIGQFLKDNERDIVIIDKKYIKDKNGRDYKYYKYKCNRCGAELWMVESNLLNRNLGCACCSNHQAVKGINDIATTNPELVKYFSNIEDAYKYTYSSGNKVLMKCPNCNYEKEVSIDKLYNQGFSCPKCSDGISYPEKIMFNLLKALNINYIKEYSKTNCDWINNGYRYDFYFELNNEDYIIETHGEQHYRENTSFKMSLQEVQENDKNKKELALKNGIKEDNYIVVDCRYSDLKFLKNNILHGRLNEIFDLDDIDWIKIGQDSEKSLVKEVCDYFNNNNEYITSCDLEKMFLLSRNTIINYLKKGNKLKWCKYDVKEENIKGRKKASISRSNPIKLLKNHECLGLFLSSSELERQSENLFGVKLNNSKISMVCNNKKPQYKGFTFEHIPKEEFNSLLSNKDDTYKLFDAYYKLYPNNIKNQEENIEKAS